jgi:hypothetical protein
MAKMLPDFVKLYAKLYGQKQILFKAPNFDLFSGKLYSLLIPSKCLKRFLILFALASDPSQASFP